MSTTSSADNERRTPAMNMLPHFRGDAGGANLHHPDKHHRHHHLHHHHHSGTENGERLLSGAPTGGPNGRASLDNGPVSMDSPDGTSSNLHGDRSGYGSVQQGQPENQNTKSTSFEDLPEVDNQNGNHNHHHHHHHHHLRQRHGGEGEEAEANGHHHHHHHHRHHHHQGVEHYDSVPDMVQRSAKSAIEMGQDQGSPQKQKHGLVKRYFTTLKESKSRKKLNQEPSYIPVKGVNLRDVGAVTKGPMREGAVFRSSELLSKEEMQTNSVKTILDLRRMDRPCKAQKGNKASESTKTVLKYLLWGPQKIIPEKRLIPAHRAHPQPCPLCKEKAGSRYDRDITVIHADLIPSTVGLRILQSMPWKVQLKTVCYACIGRGASSVMAPAVANDKLLGYKALYKTLLEDSKRGMAMAIRPFVDADNYPILVHCIHGKDRTGLIIMLLLMLCDVDQEAIVDDYVMSETVLKESRMHQELHMDVYLTSDDVIAATKETMEDTIEYVKEKYGSAADYFKECGLEKAEIEAISQNLKKHTELHTSEPVAFKPRFSITESLQSGLQKVAMPFRMRRSSTSREAKNQTSNAGFHSLDRVSEGQDMSQKSLNLEGASKLNLNKKSSEAASMKRASLATTDATELRARLAKLRMEHPELGPVTEEPVDFLKVPDVKSVRERRAKYGLFRSFDLDRVSAPKKEAKRPPRLSKTISCPASPTLMQTKGRSLKTLDSLRSSESSDTATSYPHSSRQLSSLPENAEDVTKLSSLAHSSVTQDQQTLQPRVESTTILEASNSKHSLQGSKDIPVSPFG